MREAKREWCHVSTFGNGKVSGLADGASGPRSDPDRLAARAPAAGLGREDAGAGRPAGTAASVGGQRPGAELVPVAAYQRRTAARAVGGLAGRIVDVAGIDVVQAGGARDVARAPQ